MSAEITKTEQNVTVHNWGKGHIQIQGSSSVRTHLTEFHFKEDGAADNGPSFAIVTQQGFHGQKIVTEFSLKTLNECLAPLGYTLFEP